MKQRVIIISVLYIAFGFVLSLGSCSKSGNDTTVNPPAGNSADSLLTNLGTNIILPSYQQLTVTTAALDAAVITFNSAPAMATLTDVQNKFKNAYTSWTACSEFEFGPAEDIFLTTHFTNSFPADTTIIINNINGAAYAIDGLGNFAAQGFPALDYLLFASGSAATLARFTTNSNATGAKQYLAALSASLKTKSAAVATAWSASGGNYLSKFIKATGTDAGSSLSLLVNAYVKDFDVTLQNYKIGIPIGLYGPSVLPKSPEKVEAYYSGFSDELLVAQIQAYQNIYAGGSDKGLDDKVAATNVQKNGLPLNEAIKNQIATVLSKMQALPAPLSEGIRNNSTTINEAYTEVRKLTVLLKVDMCSALGIRISFQDDDGD